MTTITRKKAFNIAAQTFDDGGAAVALGAQDIDFLMVLEYANNDDATYEREFFPISPIVINADTINTVLNSVGLKPDGTYEAKGTYLDSPAVESTFPVTEIASVLPIQLYSFAIAAATVNFGGTNIDIAAQGGNFLPSYRKVLPDDATYDLEWFPDSPIVINIDAVNGNTVIDSFARVKATGKYVAKCTYQQSPTPSTAIITLADFS